MEEEEIIRVLSLLHKGVVPSITKLEYDEVRDYIRFYLDIAEDEDEYECWEDAQRCLFRSYNY